MGCTGHRCLPYPMQPNGCTRDTHRRQAIANRVLAIKLDQMSAEGLRLRAAKPTSPC